VRPSSSSTGEKDRRRRESASSERVWEADDPRDPCSRRDLGRDIPTVFLPHYGLALAKLLVAGSDVWLNTPLPPLEASGTSGMKAAHNGVPSLSVRDGWWIDGWIEGVTGWAIDGDHESHAAALYAKLRDIVLPLYATGGDSWAAVMRGAIVHNASLFNSHLMLRRYAAEVYQEAA
jgi:starch phosphorylase